jgi:hypothetical protein
VLPITSGAQNSLLYDRWVKQRAADVERWSNGRLGYVHIQSMGDDSFRKVYSDILGKYNHCEGIVIDTRWNGGGRLHEDIEILFSGQKYFTQVVRGVETCDMPSRRWNKPSIMVQCEANYSNAHGTPWVYKHRGIGKLVGAPVPGTMTSVNWVTLQDPSLVFGIPVVGYKLPDGSYLENAQLEPDIHVLNAPETVVIDTEFLRTLDHDNILSGYAEMLKHGLISNEGHFSQLLHFDIDHVDYKALGEMVGTSVAVKENIVEEDPLEHGIRKALNLGHTAGHALESWALTRKPVLHGYAVAWGLICELYLSCVLTGFPTEKMRQVVRFVKENYGVLPITCNDYEELYGYMTHDKKNTANTINFTLLGGVGDIRINQTASKEEIFQMLDFYREGL